MTGVQTCALPIYIAAATDDFATLASQTSAAVLLGDGGADASPRFDDDVDSDDDGGDAGDDEYRR